MGVLRVPHILDLRGLDGRRSLDGTANKNFTIASELEVVFKDLGVLADSVDPPLTLLNRQGDVFEEKGVDGELSFLGNEASGNTQSTNPTGIVVSDDPQFSPNGQSLDLLNEFSLVSV